MKFDNGSGNKFKYEILRNIQYSYHNILYPRKILEGFNKTRGKVNFAGYL